MTAKVLLTLALAAIYLYAIAQGPQGRILKYAISGICVLGTTVVWMPDVSTLVANRLNIGRGADLITYVWILLTLLIAINVHVRLRMESERITLIAREISMLNAKLGSNSESLDASLEALKSANTKSANTSRTSTQEERV